MVVPLFAQDLGAGPAVVRREGHGKEFAQFAIKVRQVGLGPGEHADGDIAQLTQPATEQAQGGALAGARVAEGQGEAAFADLLLDAPAEVLQGRGHPEGGGGDFRREGVKLETVEGEELFIHEGLALSVGEEVISSLGR